MDHVRRSKVVAVAHVLWSAKSSKILCKKCRAADGEFLMSFAPWYYNTGYFLGIRNLGSDLDPIFREGTFFYDGSTNLEIGEDNDQFISEATYYSIYALWAAQNGA